MIFPTLGEFCHWIHDGYFQETSLEIQWSTTVEIQKCLQKKYEGTKCNGPGVDYSVETYREETTEDKSDNLKTVLQT